MKTKTVLPIHSRISLSEHLAQQILAYIRSENLGPNERLPSVRALAQSFSVATPTLREALRRLESTGTIEIKHGSGIYVKEGADLAEAKRLMNKHRLERVMN
jgi:GntR family transcriptional regulator, transcriptional repressor for pyruvate dehydrogenase complex